MELYNILMKLIIIWVDFDISFIIIYIYEEIKKS